MESVGNQVEIKPLQTFNVGVKILSSLNRLWLTCPAQNYKEFLKYARKNGLSLTPQKLSITRKKKTESISVENNRVNEIRKETQLDLNLELSDIPKSLVDFIKKHL